jgi:hypothetical protein
VSSQIKSRERVVDHGEVFTSEREVNAMLDLVVNETHRIDSRFLEPACGTGNFLIEVLNRKLEVVSDRYRKSQIEFERYAVIAVGSIYGVDLLEDNVDHCRQRLFEAFDLVYGGLYGAACSDDCRTSIRFILTRNILWGDALTMKTVCGNEDPIVFSEWSAVNGSMVKRRDYSFAHLLTYQPMDGPNLFSDMGDQAFIPKPVRDYPLAHYTKLNENA